MSEHQNDVLRKQDIFNISARFTCRYDKATNRVIVEDGGAEVAVFKRGNTELAEEYTALLEASRSAHDGYGAIANRLRLIFRHQ